MLEEQFGVIDGLWLGGSLLVLIIWLIRTRGGINALDRAPRPAHNLNMADLLIVGMLYVGTLLISGSIMGMQEERSWQRLDLSSAVSAAGQLVTVGFILHLIRQRFAQGWEGFGLRRKNLLRSGLLGLAYFTVGTGLTFLTLLVTLTICRYFGYETVQRHQFLEFMQEEPPLRSWILLIGMPVFVAPLAEEIIFRGVMQSALSRKFSRLFSPSTLTLADDAETHSQRLKPTTGGMWLGIVVTSLFFPLFHGQWQHWPALFVLAMVLGYSYARHGNLWIPIIIHALFNGLSVLTAVLAKFCEM